MTLFRNKAWTFTAAPAALAVAALALVGCSPSAEAQDPLAPDLAYPYEISADANEIRLNFAVLDGYYLYRDKFNFAVEGGAVTIGAPQIPTGEIHSDEFFGEQEIYRHEFEIAIPFTRSSAVDFLSKSDRITSLSLLGTSTSIKPRNNALK